MLESLGNNVQNELLKVAAGQERQEKHLSGGTGGHTGQQAKEFLADEL